MPFTGKFFQHMLLRSSTSLHLNKLAYAHIRYWKLREMTKVRRQFTVKWASWKHFLPPLPPPPNNVALCIFKAVKTTAPTCTQPWTGGWGRVARCKWFKRLKVDNGQGEYSQLLNCLPLQTWEKQQHKN